MNYMVTEVKPEDEIFLRNVIDCISKSIKNIAMCVFLGT